MIFVVFLVVFVNAIDDEVSPNVSTVAPEQDVTVFNVSNGTSLDNDTEFTTELPESTTLIVGEPKRNVTKFESVKIDHGYIICKECFCNVIPEACDVNCCCDPVCTDDDVKVFSDCDNYVRDVDDRFCLRSDIFSQINAPYALVEVEKGLRCFVSTTTKAKQCYSSVEPLEVVDDFNFMTKEDERYNMFSRPIADLSPESKMVFGRPVLIILTNEEIRVLGLPRPKFGFCHGFEAINYLLNANSTCKTIIHNNDSCENVPYLNAKWFFTGFMVYPNVSIEVQLCDKRGNCENRSEISEPFFNRTSRTCTNVVRGLKYVIAHDGINGIESVKLNVFLHNVTLLDDPISVTQTFSVTFHSINKMNGKQEHAKSGNLGYHFGLPVIVGTLKNGSLQSRWIEIPTMDNCRSTERVNFGTNIVSGCLLTIKSNSSQSVCDAVASDTNKVFKAISEIDVVSMYGNWLESDNWIPIWDDNSTTGYFEVNRQISGRHVVCSNVVLSIRLTVMYVKQGKTSHPQLKIIGVSKKYVKGEALVERKNSNHIYSVHLTVFVSFVDATNY